MNTLRITQTAEALDHFRVEVMLEGAGLTQFASAEFDFVQTPQD